MATQDLQIPPHTPISQAPTDIASIAEQERANPFPQWNATVAFQLGCALRTRLLAFDKPCVVHISTTSEPGHVLFHSVTHSGTTLDNDFWVSRKRKSVIRFGCSTWQLHHKFNGGDEALFASKNGLGERAGEYAIHGGGVPVFVQGCESMVAVVVVSGLKQWDDHQVVVEEMGKLVAGLGRGK